MARDFLGAPRNLQQSSEFQVSFQLSVQMPVRRYIKPLIGIRRLPLVVRWLGSALLVGLAFAIRYVAFEAEPVSPYLGFLPAVILSAVIFDRGSGFFATVLSALTAVYFFVPPAYTLALPHSMDVINLGLFLLVGFFIAGVTEALHNAYFEAEDTNRALAEARA